MESSLTVAQLLFSSPENYPPPSAGTFIPVKTVHKITRQNTVQLDFIDSANSRSPPVFSSESSTNILILSL